VGLFVAYEVCLLLQRTAAHPIQRPVGGIMIRDARGGYHTVGAPHEGNGHAAHEEEHEEAVLERVGGGAGEEPEASDDDPPGGAGGDGGSALPGDDGHSREA
jgi:hypothetical protein